MWKWPKRRATCWWPSKDCTRTAACPAATWRRWPSESRNRCRTTIFARASARSSIWGKSFETRACPSLCPLGVTASSWTREPFCRRFRRSTTRHRRWRPPSTSTPGSAPWSAAGGNHAALHGADPGVAVDGGRQRLCRVVLLRNLRQKGSRVQEDAVTPNGQNDGHARVPKLFPQVEDLADARANVVVLHRFLDSDGHRLHVAAGHAAVRVQSFEGHQQVARRFGHFHIVHRQESADVGQRVFLGAHGTPVAGGAKVLDDLAHAPPLLARLALLDEPGVFGDARVVEDDFHRIAPRQFIDRLHVGERNGLAAGHVHGSRHADVRNAAGILLEYALQLAQIHVSLERALRRWVVRLVDDDVHEASAGHLLVETRRREVHVARDDVASR